MKKTFFSLFLTLMIIFGLTGCGGETNPVTKIAVTKAPTKTVYNIGEKFSAEGGELTVSYEDGTEEVISLTNEVLQVTSVDTSRAGSKAVRIIYSMRRTQFSIEVKPFVVNFVLGEGKGTLDPIEIKKIGAISNMPADPVAKDFEFDGWYTDNGFTKAFDPKADITGDITLYAKWLDIAATLYNVRFDYNYGVGSPNATRQRVESGKTANKPADPERRGYKFEGWFTEANGGEEYDFSTPITADNKIYAHWTLMTTTAEEYIFEAEDIDLDDMSGVGYSSNQSGPGMIMDIGDPAYGVSNDRALGYLYLSGLTVDFYFVSNKEISDAKIVARLGAEYKDHHLTPDMFTITLNGKQLDYGQIYITEVPNAALGTFKDYEIAVNASLLEGENVLTMKVNNSIKLIGGATSATAPIIDCVKIITSAVLWWNGEKGLPKANY